MNNIEYIELDEQRRIRQHIARRWDDMKRVEQQEKRSWLTRIWKWFSDPDGFDKTYKTQ